MLRGLQSRLTLSYLLIIVVCLVLVGLAALLLLRGYQADMAYRRLEDRSVLAARLLSTEIVRRQQTPPDSVRWLARELNRDGQASLFVYLLDPAGAVIAANNTYFDGQRFDDLAAAAAAAAAWPVRGVRRTGARGRILYVAEPVWRQAGASAGELRYVLVLATPSPRSLAAAADLLPRLVLAGVVALVVSVVVAAVVAYSIARPLDRIARAAEEIAAGNYDQQLDIAAPEEVARLAASFNAMAGRVRASLQSQRDLLANVSHELKTPLTSIQGFSQALLDGTAAAEPGRSQAAAVIHEEADRMRRLVDDLLDLARLEAGQVKLAREPVDVAGLLARCAARAAPYSAGAGVSVEVQVPPALPPVLGDADRLGQVFGNLVDNAIRHTAGGAPPAHVVLRAEQHDGAVVCFVTDNGPGIPAGDLARIFERFYQVDKSRARPQGGAGLGLAIAQEIVTAHGGRISVESVEGLGTRFAVRLPAQSV